MLVDLQKLDLNFVQPEIIQGVIWGQKQQFLDRTSLTPRACCLHARLNLIAIAKQSVKNPTFLFSKLVFRITLSPCK